MTKILAFLIALILLASGWSPQITFEPGVAADIFIPRHINHRESVIAVVTIDTRRININFYANELSSYLWDISYDDSVIGLEEVDGKTVYKFRIKKYAQSSILMRLVVPGQLYCPEYILRIDIPDDRSGKVLYTQYVPEYAREKEEEGFMNVFLGELFCGR